MFITEIKKLKKKRANNQEAMRINDSHRKIGTTFNQSGINFDPDMSIYD